ncbi:MAG: hypothetical protein H0V47_15905 [Chloroflexia bacterium]|jgi:hypothetical protein|nr:hypothetical protein [Chloroflexia bacterium]
MATTTTQSERIDLQLKYIAGTLADLEDVARDWDQEPIHVTLAWPMEWRNDMDGLEFLYEAYERRVLNEEQQEYFLNLLDWVQRLLPVIQRLELDVPRVPLNTCDYEARSA